MQCVHCFCSCLSVRLTCFYCGRSVRPFLCEVLRSSTACGSRQCGQVSLFLSGEPREHSGVGLEEARLSRVDGRGSFLSGSCELQARQRSVSSMGSRNHTVGRPHHLLAACLWFCSFKTTHVKMLKNELARFLIHILHINFGFIFAKAMHVLFCMLCILILENNLFT